MKVDPTMLLKTKLKRTKSEWLEQKAKRLDTLVEKKTHPEMKRSQDWRGVWRQDAK